MQGLVSHCHISNYKRSPGWVTTTNELIYLPGSGIYSKRQLASMYWHKDKDGARRERHIKLIFPNWLPTAGVANSPTFDRRSGPKKTCLSVYMLRAMIDEVLVRHSYCYNLINGGYSLKKKKSFFVFFFKKTTFVSVLLNWNYLEGQMTLKPRYNPEKQGLLLCMNLRRAIIGSSKQVIDVARNWTTCFAWNLHLLLSHYRCKCMHIFTNSNRCCCIHIISQFVQYILSCWLITG